MKAYLVMALNETVTVVAGVHEIKMKIEDCLGFFPVYETRKEAESNSFDGKYEVVPTEIPSITERAEA